MHRILLVLLVASSAVAATGSDSFGYTYVDSDEAGGPKMDWEEISTTGTALFTGAWNNAQAPSGDFGFDFPLYGASYRSCTVSTNGLLQFGTPNPADSANGSLPSVSMPGLIAPFWDNLQAASSGTSNVYVQAISVPTPHVVIEWYRARTSSSGGVIIIGGGGGSGELTFQAKLYPDGTIFFNYLTMTGSASSGSSATVGIQGSGTGPALTYLYNGAPSGNLLSAGMAIQFSLGSKAPDAPKSLEQAAATGGPAQPPGFISDATAVFRATVTDPDGHDAAVDVEILPASVPFDPSLITGVLVSGSTVPSGQVAEVAVTFTGAPYGNGDYHWRLRARDQYGLVSSWVDFDPAPVHFIVDIVPPGPATPLAPADGSDVLVPDVAGGWVTFAWTDAVDVGPPVPLSYRVEIAKDPAFGVMADTGLASSATYAAWLPTSGSFYYWKVTPIDAAGNEGPASVAWSFRVVADDGINHSSGDAVRSCGFAARGSSTHSAWLLGALLLTLAAVRRPR